MVSPLQKQETYNPSLVLSSVPNREEYDFLFSHKSEGSSTSAVTSVLETFKDVGNGFVEMFSGNPNSDPTKIGELNRVGTQYAAGFQSLLGVSKMLTGDIYSGVYNSLLGALGVSCSREGKSKDMLKTYTVISFINGCVQVMEVVQMSLSGFPILGHGLPAIMKVAHLISVFNPCASFLGTYLSWQYIKAAKKQYLLALAHYQLQMLMLHQQQQMMQASAVQQQAIGPADPKRLPPIPEAEEEDPLREGTGGSENKRIEELCVDFRGEMIRG